MGMLTHIMTCEPLFHYIFSPSHTIGLKGAWQHKNECSRVNYSRDKETVTKELKIIAEQVKRAYDTA